MKTKNAMQLKAMIKRVSVQKNISPQLAMQNYMLERILARIEKSEFQKNFIVKGGFLIGSMVGIDSRTTMDLDTTITGFSLTHEILREIFEEICKVEADDDMQFSIESISDIKFVMGDTWRNIISNYNGQVLKFTVTTKVKEFEGYEALAENKATLSYENNLSVDTNLVTTSLTKPYMVQIVKSIPDSASQLGDGHGKPTFVFKISGNYRRFTFEEEKCKRTDLFAHKNVTFSNYSLIKM